MDNFIRIIYISAHSAQNGVGTDEIVETLTDRGTEKGGFHNYIGHITLTERDRTRQHQGGEQREGRVSEVESESRAEGVSACHDCMGVFQFLSHLIFGPCVQGFSVALKTLGV